MVKGTKSIEAYGNKENINILGACIEKNLPVLLMGETGTGKTTIVRSLAEQQKKTVIRINMNGQTGREEFVGKYVLINGETVWQDGPLVVAMKKGYWLLVDELNVALPEIIFVMQSILESGDGKLGDLFLSEKDGEVVTPHKDFRVFATSNPATGGYVGTKDINTATLSRFIVVEVSALEARYERKLLETRFADLDPAEIFGYVNLACELRKAHEKRNIDYYCSTRDLVNLCTLTSTGIDKKSALSSALLNKVTSRSSKEKVAGIIANYMQIELDFYKQTMSEIDSVMQSVTEKEALSTKIVELEEKMQKMTATIKQQEAKVKAYDELKEKMGTVIQTYQGVL